MTDMQELDRVRLAAALIALAGTRQLDDAMLDELLESDPAASDLRALVRTLAEVAVEVGADALRVSRDGPSLYDPDPGRDRVIGAARSWGRAAADGIDLA